MLTLTCHFTQKTQSVLNYFFVWADISELFIYYLYFHLVNCYLVFRYNQYAIIFIFVQKATCHIDMIFITDFVTGFFFQIP